MKRIDNALLDHLSVSAQKHPRRRLNHNLHEQPEAVVQRLCNALEPGTDVRPHRHVTPAGVEVFVALSGSAYVLLFDDDGVVTEREEISSEGPLFGLEIPKGAWHTIGCLEPRTVLFEVKEGPYNPALAKEFAPWAPPETNSLTAFAERWLRRAEVGDPFPSSFPTSEDSTHVL